MAESSGSDDQQTQLRRAILALQKDESLSPEEKAKKMQELMTARWSSQQKLHAPPKSAPSDEIQHAVTYAVRSLAVRSAAAP